jgi:hypothetical protein
MTTKSFHPEGTSPALGASQSCCLMMMSVICLSLIRPLSPLHSECLIIPLVTGVPGIILRQFLNLAMLDLPQPTPHLPKNGLNYLLEGTKGTVSITRAARFALMMPSTETLLLDLLTTIDLGGKIFRFSLTRNLSNPPRSPVTVLTPAVAAHIPPPDRQVLSVARSKRAPSLYPGPLKVCDPLVTTARVALPWRLSRTPR